MYHWTVYKLFVAFSILFQTEYTFADEEVVENLSHLLATFHQEISKPELGGNIHGTVTNTNYELMIQRWV